MEIIPHGLLFQSLPPSTGHSAQIFPRIPAPGFQPNIPPMRAPFGFGAVDHLSHLSGFPEDLGATFNPIERPKKVIRNCSSIKRYHFIYFVIIIF